jgi:hypothetical protein
MVVFRLWFQLTATEPSGQVATWFYERGRIIVDPFRRFDTVRPVKDTGLMDYPAFMALEACLIVGLGLMLLIWAFHYLDKHAVDYNIWRGFKAAVGLAVGSALAAARFGGRSARQAGVSSVAASKVAWHTSQDTAVATWSWSTDAWRWSVIHAQAAIAFASFWAWQARVWTVAGAKETWVFISYWSRVIWTWSVRAARFSWAWSVKAARATWVWSVMAARFTAKWAYVTWRWSARTTDQTIVYLQHGYRRVYMLSVTPRTIATECWALAAVCGRQIASASWRRLSSIDWSVLSPARLVRVVTTPSRWLGRAFVRPVPPQGESHRPGDS